MTSPTRSRFIRTGTKALRVAGNDSGVMRLRRLVNPLNHRHRRPRPPKVDRSTISPAEYWTYLCAAALLVLTAVVSHGPKPGGQFPERPASGAFGTTRSSDEPQPVQHARAHEPGRGRHADTPWRIPWRGWKDILWRTYQQMGEDRLLAVAAGVVFYGLLALFPALTALVSLYGLFAKASTINDHLSMAAGILPGGAVDIIREQITRLVSKGDAKLGFGFIICLGIALWSANAGMKAIMDALNVVYEEKEKRSFIKLNLVSFAFTLAAIASMLLALGAVVVVPLVLRSREHDRNSLSGVTLASVAHPNNDRSGAYLSLRPEPSRAALAVDQRWQRVRRNRVARQLRVIVVVSLQLRQL